jgi:phosphohistidine phosphatase
MKLFTALAIVVLLGCLAAFKSFTVQTENSNVKKVYLMRHAKSSHENATLKDFDRPLDPEGETEAAEMGEYLSQHGVKPDLIVASPAVRTRATAKIICEKLSYDLGLVKWDSTIYACTTEALLNAVKTTGEKYNSVIFIGHNNAMTNVANVLQSEEKIADMPTCSVVAVAFPDSTWNTIDKGKLIFYKKPR